ncbi:MAG: hypothetical protein K0M40_22590 [Prolixibacteraceae bacterium]|nr:hypothetical protein [Prolixibacteraceae bacterium]
MEIKKHTPTKNGHIFNVADIGLSAVLMIDCKNELGMSGYQVTGWLAWQHHMALVMMASLYILTLKLENQEEMPLLSVRDARLLVIAKAFTTQVGLEPMSQTALNQLYISSILLRVSNLTPLYCISLKELPKVKLEILIGFIKFKDLIK